jgi:hypothetical protein
MSITTPKNAFVKLTLSTLNALYQLRHAGVGIYQSADKSVKSFQYLKNSVLTNGMYQLHYHSTDKSIILDPDYLNKSKRKDMYGRWDSTYGLYDVSSPNPEWCGSCLCNGFTEKTDGLEWYTATSVEVIDADSSFIYTQFVSDESYIHFNNLTDGDFDHIFQLTVGKNVDVEGSGYMLEFSAVGKPTFYGEYDALLGKRPVLGYYKITEEELSEYRKGGASQWAIYSVNGEVVIFSTILNERWVIPGVRTIPQGKMEVSIGGINTAFNMQNITFATSGYFISDWINVLDCDYEIQTTDPEQTESDTRFVYYPQLNPNGEFKFSVYDSEFQVDSDGNTLKNRIKIRVDMTGDGVTTPFLRGWQFLQQPVFRVVNDPPITIQDYIGSVVLDDYVDGANISMNNDIATDTVSISLQNDSKQVTHALYNVLYEKQEGDDPDLPDFTPVLLHGNLLAVLTYGYEQYTDDVREVLQENAFIGYIPASQISSNLNSEKMTFNIRSLAYPCMQSSLYTAPCLTGFAVIDAIALIAVWGGIHPDFIHLHEIKPTYPVDNFSYIMDSIVGIEYTAGNDTRTLFIAGDEFNLDSPMWLCNNQKAWEVISRICDRYGYSVWVDGSGIFNVQKISERKPLAGHDNYYNYDLKWEDYEVESKGALRSLEITPVDNDITNVVVGEGKDQNGKTLLAICAYKDSVEQVNSRRYVGYKISYRLQDDEIITMDDLKRAIRNYAVIHQPGRVTISVEGFYGNLFGLVPGDIIQVAADYPQIIAWDENGQPVGDPQYFHFFRIRTITYDSPQGVPHWTCKAEAEFVDIANPWAFNMIGAKAALGGVRAIVNAMRPLKAGLQDDFDGQVEIVHPDWQYFTIGLSLSGGADKIKPDGV